jgi:hypothetical protein
MGRVIDALTDKLALKLLFLISLLPDQIKISELRKFWKLSLETDSLQPLLSKLQKLNVIKISSDDLKENDKIEMPSTCRDYAESQHSGDQR